MEYDPNLLSDPQWPCGKHKRVLVFASYMVRGRVFVLLVHVIIRFKRSDIIIRTIGFTSLTRRSEMFPAVPTHTPQTCFSSVDSC